LGVLTPPLQVGVLKAMAQANEHRLAFVPGHHLTTDVHFLASLWSERIRRIKRSKRHVLPLLQVGLLKVMANQHGLAFLLVHHMERLIGISLPAFHETCPLYKCRWGC